MTRLGSIANLAWGLAGLAMGFLSFTGPLRAADDWRNLYLDAKPILDVRYRFEYVDQDGFSRDARANTVRTRAGFETGRYFGLGLGFDAEWTETIGRERFNSTTNGKTQFPVVADPDNSEVNQLFIVAEDTIPGTLLKLGRQRIVWDNQRFLANVGFRQNEQTFDAFRGTITAVRDTTFEYVYLEEVHRIFGDDSPVGELGLDSHGVRAQFSGFDWLALTPFALLLDYDARSQAGLDSQSYGALLVGSRPLDDEWGLLYAGSLAYQADLADNPADFALWYYFLEPGLSYRGISLKAGYEVLQGDGSNAFQTPLATLHKFNGATDQFLTTPPDGLEDLYLALEAPLPGKEWLSNLVFKAAYHQFWAEKGGAHYGSEWDAGLFKRIPLDFGFIDLGIQYGSYDADRFSSDTEKLWLTLQFRISPRPLRAHLEDPCG